MNREFEAIFFDMDGTLINSEPHWLLAETELMAEYGHPWTKEDQQYCLGGPLPKIGKYMWELSGQSMSPEYFHQELVRRAIARIIAGTEFMPGASELLHEAISEGVLVESSHNHLGSPRPEPDNLSNLEAAVHAE